MTREQMIDVMARAICVDDDVDPDVVGYDRTGSDFPNWYVVQGTAETVLLALEAAGQRVVPVEATEEMVSEALLDMNMNAADVRYVWKRALSAAPGAPHE